MVYLTLKRAEDPEAERQDKPALQGAHIHPGIRRVLAQRWDGCYFGWFIAEGVLQGFHGFTSQPCLEVGRWKVL